ncbi:MAG: tetratricopeptide repeat protein [Hyphomonadaceae bacterium]
MRRAAATGEASFGPDHSNVAIRLNNLAAPLLATNRLSDAEPLMRRALAIDETSFGPDHPEVARDLNNLAQLLKGHQPAQRRRAADAGARSPSTRRASAPTIPTWPPTSTIWPSCCRTPTASAKPSS